MAAQGSVKDWFTFVGGLNTEGGYFVTPDNSWKQGDNVIPQLDGSIHRRNGIDLEKDFTQNDFFISASDFTNIAVATTVWNPLPSLSFIVVQQGPYLFFFTNTSSSVSNTLNKDRVALRKHPITTSISDAVTGQEPCSFSQINGDLIVTSSNTTPFRVYLNGDNEIKSENISLKIRDFEGFTVFQDDGLTERTETAWDTWYLVNHGLSNGAERALYNLKNQGWGTTQISTYKSSYANLLPSNTKSWIYGKNASDVFDATLLNKQDFGTSLAPKGRNIIDAFNQVRTEGAFSETTVYTSRPTVTAAFAGRVWYAGLSDSALQGKIYFSQVVDNTNKLGRCYQSNDPTSEIVSDLVDSDGGIIAIPDAGKIIKLAALGKGLLVFGENGVFSISGIDGVFSATNFQVEKITNVGSVSESATIAVENAFVYWSTEGIYSISLDPSGFTYKVDNISDQKIKTYYTDIPLLSKKYASGTYNSSQKELYWLYNAEEVLDEYTSRYIKNKLLCFNLTLNSWHTHDVPVTSSIHAQTILTTKEVAIATQTADVITSTSDTVVDSSSNVVTSFAAVPQASQKHYKIVSSVPTTVDTTYKTETIFSTTNTSNSNLYDYWGNYHYLKKNELITKQSYDIAICTGTSSAFYSSSKISVVTTTSGASHTFDNQLEYDTSTSNVLHSGWGATSFTFNNDGTRLYVSQRNSTPTWRLGYYTLTTAYDVTSVSSFTVVTGAAVPADISHMSINGNKLNLMIYVDAGTSTRHIQMRTYDIEEDGNFNVLPTEYLNWTYNNLNPNQAFNAFSFTPDGMNIIVGLTNYNDLSGFSDITSIWIYPLKQQYVAASARPLHSIASLSVMPFGGGRRYFMMPPDNFGKLFEFSMPYPTIYPRFAEYNILDAYKYDMIGPYNDTQYSEVHNFNFADFINTRTTDTKYKDWYSIDNVGLEQEAYVLTGYQLADVGPARMKTGMYLNVYAKRTETYFDSNGNALNPSSIQMQLRWDFSDNLTGNKWSPTVETYRHVRPFIPEPGAAFETGSPLVITKNKIRGRGKALQFKFSTSDGKDMQLVGWTGTFVGNTNV